MVTGNGRGEWIVAVMLRVLLMGLLLRRARREHPELFDGAAAWASIEAQIAEYEAP